MMFNSFACYSPNIVQICPQVQTIIYIYMSLTKERGGRESDKMHAKFFELEDYEEVFKTELITLGLKCGGTLRVNRRWETKNICMRSLRCLNRCSQRKICTINKYRFEFSKYSFFQPHLVFRLLKKQGNHSP